MTCQPTIHPPYYLDIYAKMPILPNGCVLLPQGTKGFTGSINSSLNVLFTVSHRDKGSFKLRRW